MENTQQPGEILSPDQFTSIAVLLRSFGVSISTADANQHTSQSVCNLLKVSPANQHLATYTTGKGLSLLDSAKEGVVHE